MPAQTLVEQSAIGNLADLQEGQVALTRFIVKRDTGVYVNLANYESTADFGAFVDHIFSAGAFFRALDYKTFLALLYDDARDGASAEPQEIRFATDIVTFQPDRQALYKALKVENGEAVYLFEPVYLESTLDEPVIGELEDGSIGVIRCEQKTIFSRAHLDVDEFIAMAWQKEVRYGIDPAAIGEAIRGEKTERVVVARPRPYTLGRDAEIKEQTSDLRRDNAPRQLSGGRIDLRQFQNRYPQVTAGVRLIRKAPRVLGVDGRDIAGKVLLAPLPSDFDLGSLGGAGTRIVQEKDGECLVAAVGGFLNIDTATNQLSITDKIINREGVSARTTGDLSLTGEEYEEFGEIQERRAVVCRSITAHADVFGSILSHGGAVVLKKNLVGGNATNEEGDIVVEGLASGATLIALKGSVRVGRAESCLIIAQRIFLGQGTRCDLLADELEVERADGCALAGKAIHVVASGSRGQNDCVLSLLIPDLSGYQARINAVNKKRELLLQNSESQRAKGAALRAQKEVASYLAVAGKLQRKELTLSAEQQGPWQKLLAQVTPVLRALAQLAESVKQIDEQAAVLAGEADALRAAAQEACAGIACTVDRVSGDTRIRTLAVKLDAPALTTLSPKDLKARLRATDAATASLFSGNSGTYAWHYEAPAS